MQINTLIRNAILDDKPRNIIVASYDGLFEYMLAENTPHKYFLLENIGLILQATIQHERIHILNPTNIPIDLDIDLIICNDIVSQIGRCLELSKAFQVPLLIVHHSLKPPFVKTEDLLILKKEHQNATRITTLNYVATSWRGSFPVLNYIFPTIENKPKTKDVLIIGTFNPQHTMFVREVASRLHKQVTILGNNPGISQVADLNTCVDAIQTHQIFLNLWNDLDTNQFMLYAMKAGATIVSNPSPPTEQFITHGINGYIGNSVDDIARYINAAPLLAPPTVMEGNPTEWNQLINKLCHTPYRT